ncbi:Ribosomal RNA small subunit methyltransferase E [Nitrospira japonica]|uniref:Ribosomal RNA small subunit methyltransferase E n=1 Tax=Nitrospira japonica TaxID=1325564 RepID=A0A1W1I8L4_9BACT|nr:RsmE family RNA methyltransferase [Nitrospira japonica]SLM49133.1 Ribosomal RNA small subunit methyltransferase E [Nitrospira japonica]
MPSFFVAPDAVTPPTIRITGPLLRHLKDSLRLADGDGLTLTEEGIRRHRAEIIATTDRLIECRILDTTAAPLRSGPRLVLAQALLKGEKMDWVIQKATELGADRIVPIQTKNAVVKLHPDRVEHQRARWERIAVEAAQQSERWTVPTIAEPIALSKVAAAYPSAVKFVLAERSTETSLTTVTLPAGTDQTVLLSIGPEGGWDEDELRLMREQAYSAVSLGSRILRAETAAIATLSIVQSRLGELG